MDVDFFINTLQRAMIQQMVASGAATKVGYYLPKVKMVFDSPSRGRELLFHEVFTLDNPKKRK